MLYYFFFRSFFFTFGSVSSSRKLLIACVSDIFLNPILLAADVLHLQLITFHASDVHYSGYHSRDPRLSLQGFGGWRSALADLR